MGTHRGQSETVDTLALIAVVVTLSLVVGGLGLGVLDTDSPPLLSADLDRSGGSLSLAHTGGDAIDATDVTVVARNATDEVRFGLEAATVSGDGDDVFEIGESASHALGLGGDTVRILVVHEPTNSVLLDRSVDRTPPSGDVPLGGNQPPTAGFTYSPSPPNVAEELTFDASTSSDDGTITGYEWDVDDDGVYEKTGQVITHTYETLGDRNVTLRVTDDNGATDTTTVSFSLTKAEPVAAFVYTPPTPGTGQPVAFDAAGSTDVDGTITSYEWDWTSDGTYEATGETASHGYGATGIYTVSLRVTDDDGLTDTTTALVTVNLNDAPTPSFTYSPSAPVPAQPIDFDASGSSDPDGLLATYEWDWTSDGTYDATGETATHDYPSPGTYDVTLRVTDGLGGYNTTTRTVVVEFTDNNAPTARFNASAVDWYSPAWSHRKPVEIDHGPVAADLTDVPVLIDVTDDDLVAAAQSDADDILFTAADGTTKLDHEIESYDNSSGRLIAWVTVPTLNNSAPNTTLYLYYGADVVNQENASGVWTNGYEAVWHLGEEPDDTGATDEVADSTGNGNDGSARGSMRANDDVSAKVGDGIRFDGKDDRIKVEGHVTESNTVTLSGWIKTKDGRDEIVTIGNYVGLRGTRADGTPRTFYWTGDAWEATQPSGTVDDDTWHRVTYVMDNANDSQTVYIDGFPVKSTSHSSDVDFAGDLNGDTFIGSHASEASYFAGGVLDEVRISSVAKTPGWLITSYNNQKDPSGFVSVGAEQDAYPVVTNGSVSSDPDGTITSYEWDWTADGTYDDTGVTASHAYSDPGNYTVGLRVTDDTGAANTTTGDVTVSVGNADPQVDIAVTPPDPVEEEIVSFDASGTTDPEGPITTYEWDFTDDGTWDATGATPTHEFDDDGTHTVALRLTDSAGGTFTATTTVTVSPTTFTDETASANLGSSPDGGALALADLDEDGDLDVFMNDNGDDSDAVRLRENDGDLTFTDHDDAVSVAGGRGAGTGDVDNDGDRDLIVGVGQRLNENTGGFSFSGSTVGSANNEEALMFVDIDGDGDLDIWSPGEDSLWHENTENGWDSHTTIPGDGVDRTANGEGASAADIDDDGDVDLLWAQSASDVDVFENQGDGTYVQEWDADGVYGLPEDVGNHEDMEWAWGDYDSDGDMDVYISGDDNEGLYRNDGTGQFTEVTGSAGISESNPDGAAWGDYNNDGHLDLLLADGNGNGDIYDNDGDGTFSEVDASANLDGNGDLGATLGWFDADNDGDLDIVSNDPVRLWNNTQDDGEYLRVMVRGNGTAGGSPTTPIGAQVELYDDAGTLVGHRELLASQNQLQPPLRQHFGVDPNASYDVRVRFPSGAVVWRNDTVPAVEGVLVGDTRLDNTIRVREPNGWTMFMAGPANQGRIGEAGPTANLGRWWSTTNGGTFGEFRRAGATVVDGTVYVGNKNNRVYAIAADNGSVRWSVDTGGEVLSTPAVVDDTVYVGTKAGSLLALEATTGTQQWSFTAAGEIRQSSVTVADDTVYVGTKSGEVHAVWTNGTERWQSTAPTGEVLSSPAVADGRVYVADTNGDVYAFDATNGTQRWSFSEGSEVSRASPAVADGTLYVGDRGSGTLFAIDAATGTKEWEFSPGEEFTATPVVANGTVHVGTTAGTLYALDVGTGSAEWSFTDPGEIHASAVLADGTLYVGDKAGTVYAVDAETGTELTSYATGSEIHAPPVIRDGAVFVGTKEGTLYALLDTVLLEDDFDRADANDLGNDWTETEADADEARLQDDRLDFEADNRAERPSVQHDFVEQSSGTIRLTFTFNFERTANEQYYSANVQLGDGDQMVDPATPNHDAGVAVNLKWGGNDGTVSGMADEEGFGYTDDGADTQIGVVSGDAGANAGGDASVNVTVDLDANTYDIEVTGAGLVSGTGTATDVPFDTDVDVDTLRIFLDEVAGGNFDDLEVDDVEVRRVG